MIDLEIPLKKRTRMYRFFEMVPALTSYSMLLLLVVLSFISPLAASIYLLIIIITLLIKAFGITAHTISGYRNMNNAQRINWHERLLQLEDPSGSYKNLATHHSSGFGYAAHQENLRLMASAVTEFPKPSQIYNAVIVAIYNESFDVVCPTIQSLVDTTYDKKQLIVLIAYEERGGPQTEATVQRLKEKFGDAFGGFVLVKHPAGMPDEVVGKGGNITYAGHYLQKWLDKNNIPYEDVVVTTLDSDNRPHSSYFDYVTYEYIVHEDRKHLSYQPISLFLNNIWDVPAPMRVLATGNSFWNIISAVRPHTLRNFASHSQPMSALVEMDFWSKRTIVEDGHQYWRSYFYFGGNYAVTPIYVPIYQDAVLSDTYKKTLKAQFIQLRRWSYGASDVPYVAVRVFTRHRNVPFWAGFARFLRLLDGHVSLATMSILVAVGGWVPLLVNPQAAHSISAHQLPEVVSSVQRIAMIGLLVVIFLGFKMLPPRPERYKRNRNILMLLQWTLMPITAIVYNAMAALNAQTRLLFGRYLDKFDVTDKATKHPSVNAHAARDGRDDVTS